ncbi:hypothetical protein ALT721_1870076 [Alteromonas alvinellae]
MSAAETKNASNPYLNLLRTAICFPFYLFLLYVGDPINLKFLALVHQKIYVTSMYKLESVYDTNIKKAKACNFSIKKQLFTYLNANCKEIFQPTL